MSEQNENIVDSQENNTPDNINNDTETSEASVSSTIQYINFLKNKNIMIITKEFEQTIPEILTFLKNDSNLAKDKLIILNYLESLFTTIKINSEIFLRKESISKENLYEIIIYEYVIYTNKSNSENDEKEYKKQLLNIFDILLAQVTIDRECYHCILSFLLKYFNHKNHNLIVDEKENEKQFDLNAEHLSRILYLLQRFYQYFDDNKVSLNYFFFTGDEETFIIIPNKNSIKDNKKILNLEDNLCILMFIRVFDSDQVKLAYPNSSFNILELRFNEKNKDKDVFIGLDNNNYLITNYNPEPIAKLKQYDTNCLLIKLKKKKKIKIYLNGKKIKSEKKLIEKDKEKEDIKEIVLFKNFIGVCYNFVIYRSKKEEYLPKFLENELKTDDNNLSLNPQSILRRTLSSYNKSVYYNGFTNEKLLYPFIKIDYKDDIEQNALSSLFTIDKNIQLNINDVKDFMEELIAIYMPSRVTLPLGFEKNNKNNSKYIIQDSISGLDAEFIIKKPSLNGVHIYKRILDDFSQIGGLNNLLPILEIMTKHQEFLTKDNLQNYLDILISVFAPQYQKALIKENQSNFFLYFSYFLEKIPESFFDDGLTGIFKTISSFLTTQVNENREFNQYMDQFHEYILINEKIFFKFKCEEQKDIIEIITNLIENMSDKRVLKIDIIKLVRILLHIDHDKNKLFCCKEHSEYFNEECGIMTPELSSRLKPFEELIKLLFTEYKLKIINNKFYEIDQDNNISKIFTLLTYDISPCLQKMILSLFSEFIENNYHICFNSLDQKEKQIFNILLFLLKTSILDVRVEAIKLIFIILKNDQSKMDDNKHTFIINNILPFYLFQDQELIEVSSQLEDQNYTEYSTYKPLSDELKYFEEYKSNNSAGLERLNTAEIIHNKQGLNLIENYCENENNNYTPQGDENQNTPNAKKGIIKGTTLINDVKYSLPSVNEIKKKIYSIYNTKKLNPLINNIYEIISKSFIDGIQVKLTLNLLTKIVAKGDLLLISSFIRMLMKEINNVSEKNREKLVEMYTSQNLLQWLIETCFQATLIKESNLNSQIFVPGFNINLYKLNEENKEIELSKQEKIPIIDEIINNTKQLLSNIFSKNIYMMDYIFSWSKYYYELRNERNNFKTVRNLVLDFMVQIGYENCQDCAYPDIMNNKQQKMTCYFFNLLFEFVSFYKLRQEELKKFQTNTSIYQELSKNLKLILISKMDDCKDKLKPIDIQNNIDTKFEEYPFFKTIFAFWTPLWKGETKQNRQENDIFSKYINGKKNVNINELELLFYNFKDIVKISVDEYAKNVFINRGTPVIYLMYHFFTLIFSIGGNENELKELFIDFRLFILLLIISSSTLSITSKKRKWPSEEEYVKVQETTEAILFNFLEFLYNKIKETKSQINECQQKAQKSDDNENSYLNYLNHINKLLIENLGYFLKLLNKIYREVIKNSEKNSGFWKGIKNFFIENESVKKSGGYKIILKMYNECSSLSKSTNENNYLDEITKINFNQNDAYFEKLENYINIFLEDTEVEAFFKKYSEDYKKILFPFVSYISARRDAIKNIIPIYDIRQNISSYPNELCLIPDYFQDNNSFDEKLLKSIENNNKTLNKDFLLNQKKYDIEKLDKNHMYKKEKEKLFSFTGIWSLKDFFYNKKYNLKYRILNHMSEDYTRVLLTPIIDVDYYLPKFSKFDPKNLFRNLKHSKPIYKTTELSIDPVDTNLNEDIIDNKNNKETKTPQKENKKEEIKNTPKCDEKEIIDDDDDQNKKEEENEIKNALYYIGLDNFSFTKKKLSKEEEENENEIAFMNCIQKKHYIQLDKFCMISNACLIKIGFHIRGVIFNNPYGIGFYGFETKRKGDEEDYDSDRKVCFGSIFRSQTQKYRYYNMYIPFQKIQIVLKRRYYFKKTAIEIFTEDKKSYLFRLEEVKMRELFDNIKLYMKQDSEDILIEYNKFDDRIGFINKKNLFLHLSTRYSTDKKTNMNLKLLYEKWTKWEISTLKMLMILNIYSNRSYNDINQYPVFPWIITDYESKTLPPLDKENMIRPLCKPMGMIDFTEDSKERKENYIEHWISNEQDEDRDDNYDRYGSHYSTSLYLTYYLVRAFPFSYIRIELQGKNFDDPNRLFNSLSNSFENAITQKSDLRELIPEFFCFPEMFLNMNELNLGSVLDKNGKEVLVGNVEMPKWASYDQYNFIGKHRELLECPEINEKINEWFNIIFGSKQKGKEAKKIYNLFIKQTYEDFEETYNKSTKAEKIYQCRMVEFGVTPHQLFKNDTYKRQNFNDCNKIKRSLLFHVLHKIHKKGEFTGKELDIEEIKFNFEENPIKMFYFSFKKKEKKKERIYLMTYNKIKIYSKYDKTKFFKEKHNEKDKEGIEAKGEEIKEEDNEEKEFEEKEDNDKYEMREPYEESRISSDEKHKEGYKEQSKIYIYSKYDKKLNIPRYRMKYNIAPTEIYNNGIFIALGGFWNGDIIIKQLIEKKNEEKKKKVTKKINVIKTNEMSPIIKILIDKTETFVFCYNRDGTLFLYTIDPNEKINWNLHKTINEGQGEISTIAINENLNIFIIGYKKGFCMVYTLPNCKLFNSFRMEENDLYNNLIYNENNEDGNNDESGQTNNIIPNRACISSYNNILVPDIIIISQSPLPCFVFFIKERKSLCVYSINFHFLREVFLGYNIVPNGIKKYTDYMFRDYLFIFNSIKNTIDVHRLFDLNIIISSPAINNDFIDFHFSKDFAYAYILVKTKQKIDEKSTNKILVLKPSLESGK